MRADRTERFSGRGLTEVAVALMLLGACGREPIGLDTTPDTAQIEPPEALVSDPTPFLAAASPARAPGVDVVYVSLPPGSLTSGSDVEVENTDNAVQELIPIVGGGFDPVPIPAAPGNTLRFRVFQDGFRDDLDRPWILTEWDTVVPAEVPPDIVRTYPARGRRDVPIALSVLVVFTEPIDSASVSAGSVELLVNGELVPATTNVSQDGLRVALSPSSPLAPNTDYVLRVVDSIEDQDGDQLGRVETIAFTTGTPGSQPVLAPSDLCSNNPPTAIPTFEDANLEGAIRTTLGFSPLDVLTCEIVSDLTSLYYSSTPYQTVPPPPTAIRSIVGIQNLSGLTRLVLANHALTDIGPLANLTRLDTLNLTVANTTPPTISDIGPLAALTGLSYLNLHNTTGISDLRPLLGLTGLSELHIRFNSIADLEPLRELTSLTWLNVAGNAIEDVSPLAGLTNLRHLSINQNSISDISPLSGLTNLTGHFWLLGNQLTDLAPIAGMTGVQFLYAATNNITRLDGIENLTSTTQILLADNPNLTDIGPLLANPDLAGDRITLSNTRVSCADVQRLVDRGADVSHTCGVPPVVLAPQALAQGTVGVGYFEVLMASEGTGVYTWGGGSMPPGLTISASGVISGVPTVAGRWMPSVNVRSGGAFAGRSVPIVVVAP